MKQSTFLYILLLLLIGLISSQCTNRTTPEILPVDESYKPEQPIEFPHDIHTGKHKIDCKFCHNTEFDKKNTGIPAADVCLKCHK